MGDGELLDGTDATDAALLGDGTQAMLVVDMDLHIRAISEPVSALLGYTQKELLASTIDRVVAFQPDWLRREVRALTTYGSWHGDVPYRHKDGHIIPCVFDVTVRSTAVGDRMVATIERR